MKSHDLFGSAFEPDSKLLITGASGWIGSTALEMAQKLGIQTFGLASRARPISVAGVLHNLEIFSIERVAEFRPTHVLDCAFLTPDLIMDLGVEQFTLTNQEMMENIERILTVSSVRTAVTISSGAAVFDDSALPKGSAFDLYSQLKREADRRFAAAALRAGVEYCVARAWSVTGTKFGETGKYAFSNLVSQAFEGDIVIRSITQVLRRYCSIEDFLAVSFAAARQGINEIDSGGDLVDLSRLAARVRAIVNPRSRIVQPESFSGVDEYHSNGEQWLELLEQFSLEPLSLDMQIKQIATEIKGRRSNISSGGKIQPSTK